MRSSLRAGLLLVALLGAGAQAQTVCGDCNANGSGPDILDALTAAQISAGISMASVVQLCSCDVNNDGMLSIIDALLMAQAAAGLPVPIMCPMNPCAGGGGGATPTVDITDPTGGTRSGDITITFDADDADMDPLTLIFEWSSDGGVTYTNASSTGAGSIPASPAVGVVVPVAGGTFVWASAADMVGTVMVDTVDFRLSASDGALNALDNETFDVDNTVPAGGCANVACGQTLAGMTGPGTGGMVAAFTAGPMGDTAFFNIDASARLPGESAQIRIFNITDDVDGYWAAAPGVMCGSTTIVDYVLGSAQFGLVDETWVIDDATLTAFGNMVPIAVYHWDPAPTATFDVEVTCFTPMMGACTTLTCGSSAVGMTGPGTLMAPPGVFTDGAMGDSAPFLIDASARAPGQWVTVLVNNLSDDHDLFVPVVPALTCGDPTGASYLWSETGGRFGTRDEFHNFDDATLTMWGNMIPIWVYHWDANPTGTFDISVTCVDAPTGACVGAVELVYNQQPVPFEAIGDNTGGGDDSVPSCQAGGEDSTVLFVPPATGTYTFRTCDPAGVTMLDTVLSIREGDCATGTELGCNDDGPCGPTTFQSELVSISMLQGMSYFVNIDGWNGGVGLWVLEVTTP